VLEPDKESAEDIAEGPVGEPVGKPAGKPVEEPAEEPVEEPVEEQRFVIAIIGPTATGKSDLAERLAQELDGEIVCADSMQVYKDMDIGTAKVPPAKRSVRYYCVDLVAPGEEFNAFAYQKAARAAFAAIWAQGKQPVLCGGTGLYVRAALEDFLTAHGEGEAEDGLESGSENGMVSPDCLYASAEKPKSIKFRTALSPHETRFELRQRLTAEAQELGPEAFHAKLAALDPESAALIHPRNVRRVIRAFEWLEQGSSYAEQSSEFATSADIYPTIYLGLTLPRELLYERINARVVRMMEQGLLGEVQSLVDEGYGPSLTARQAIGYKELLDALSKGGSAEDLAVAVEQIQQATRRYAKRQLTWFRRNERIHWLDAQLPLDALVKEVFAVFKGSTD